MTVSIHFLQAHTPTSARVACEQIERIRAALMKACGGHVDRGGRLDAVLTIDGATAEDLGERIRPVLERAGVAHRVLVGVRPDAMVLLQRRGGRAASTSASTSSIASSARAAWA